MAFNIANQWLLFVHTFSSKMIPRMMMVVVVVAVVVDIISGKLFYAHFYGMKIREFFQICEGRKSPPTY